MIKIYKRDSKGNTRVWEAYAHGDKYTVIHGIQAGKMQEETTTCTPKNVGKANETTAEQQAVLEVEALYRKKLERDGYKYSLDDEDALLAPMLALDYSKVPHRIPAGEQVWCSPKLDGVRTLYIPGKGLQSRKGKFYDLPHITKALEGVKHILDGEIYLHGYELNRIVSATKKTNELTPLLEFHIFDVVMADSFDKRMNTYWDMRFESPCIKKVPQVLRSIDNFHDDFNFYIQQGYEGCMLRRNEFPYEHCRSASLFKYKEFQEAEYQITGVEVDKEGNGVLDFGIFRARCRGTDEYRRHQAEHPEEYVGKCATVRYQTLTEFGIPQFPSVIAVRDYE